VALKHLTSSVFVFRRFTDGWRTGLIRHPRLHRMMIPGGHVEPEESSAEAALREVAEETGLAVTLVSPPAAPVPHGYRGRRVALPWWIAEYQVKPDNHLDVAHVHVDHLYVALADGTAPTASGAGLPDAAHQFGWYAAGDLPGLDMFDDARLLARLLLTGLASGADGTDAAVAAQALVAGLREPAPQCPQP
jgi:8-oxo-dGTP pyrophosphatase MutT (NUDIX family)